MRMTLSCYDMLCVNFAKTLCTETNTTDSGVGDDDDDMQISEAAAGVPTVGSEPCRFPKLEECAHFHYERVQLPKLHVTLQTNMDQSLHSQHTNDNEDVEWFMVQVTSGDECWLLQRNLENFRMLDDQLHQCIFDRKISQLPDLSAMSSNEEDLESKLICYLERFSSIADNSVNCGPVLNWLQMDNKGHRLLVPSEESRSINTPAVAAAYSVRRYVSQARDELNLEVGDMISVIDMASPGESMWWRGKRGFQVGFFPQHCVHIIGDKVPRNMPLPPPVVGSLALTPIKPVLRKHGKLITFFRSFILNRPSRRRLKQSGILKERVFGCDLGEHLLNTGREVPTVLKCCAEFIEANGIVDGIYRLSGVTSNIQKLRNAFDEDRVPDLYTEDILKDIHSVASLLKMYFRELPNPLCTYQLYQSFVNAVQGCGTAIRTTETDHERLLKMREAVQKLPPPHYRTLEYLMRHLARVANHSESTGMTTRNVAIVWAPNLLRCEALEIGGVAALQGVGVQAVVTEFLICYADLIFCDHLPSLNRPDLVEKENLLSKKCRPNSLNISTPTKLITLEEARSKHLVNKIEECNYIEVGGGPNNLPKKYHTIIELPPGARKRGHTKRSPLGWRMFFTKSRNSSQGNVSKNRKSTTPITINEKSITESDLTDMKRKLRSVKSAESLTSGHSEPASSEDVLGPLHSLNKPPGHNRSVSHDSYFDTLQSSQNNSEGSLLDLSEIHLNFDLEESEMRIFSEDESLVSSPRIQKDNPQRRILTRARPEEFSSAANSVNPSPKKQPRVVLSPESMSRKRTRLEDQLSDIQYIDCNTPENVINTTALVHAHPQSPAVERDKVGGGDLYQPKNKSPRNSDNLDTKRQSLNLESISRNAPPITKSFTEMDINRHYLGATSILTTPTPSSPGYKQLGESSSNTTPEMSPNYESLPSKLSFPQQSPNKAATPTTPTYENILTTINITYKSPSRSAPGSPLKSPVYENVSLNPETVVIPTSTASLPVQEASQPDLFLDVQKSDRPKSLSALEDHSSADSTLKANSSVAVCDTSEQTSLASFNEQATLSSNQSSRSNVQYTASSVSSAPYHCIENCERLSPTDLSLSEVVQSSTENLSTSHTSISFPDSPSKNSPNVSPTSDTKRSERGASNDNLTTESEVWSPIPPRPDSTNLIDFSPDSPATCLSQNDKRKSDETESFDDSAIYQQVKYFRRSIHEVNALLDLDGSKTDDGANVYEEVATPGGEEENGYDSLEHVYENVEGDELKKDGAKTDEHETVLVERFNVKDLKNKFEEKMEAKTKCADAKPKAQKLVDSQKREEEKEGNKSQSRRVVYEKDSLPPCLRARNLKHQLKTRSLDENDFDKEFGVGLRQRRKSLDEGAAYKTNSLPKTLNQPKRLPADDGRVESMHLAHSGEKVNDKDGAKELEEEQKKRERIEKYKEERRKILHERYSPFGSKVVLVKSSESFKEDKDVLLSRLKIYKGKEETSEAGQAPDPALSERSYRIRRKSTRSESEVIVPSEKSKNNAATPLKGSLTDIAGRDERSASAIEPAKPAPGSLKIKAAIFEQQNQKSQPVMMDYGKHRTSAREKNEDTDQQKVSKGAADETLKGLDFIRHKRREDEVAREERRRHTYETRERETEMDRLRRVSLESRSPRKERTSPTYCIKDMKAIFESKSKQ
ncbi:GTPase-activating protein CdGAPr isoform X3 [Cylas formicarius]|uniref:GTPase-activating protein CdGAPr isoform X3 n=1 Tax=Cylas formicarius TaxID=197179 RepID=UPI0029585E26|nr:GTPase-activating protein CdGAPr isoform X3 [Cylas formicarius]